METEKTDFSASTKLSKKPIVYFFVKLLLLTSIWFFVYTLLLRPKRIVDRPLTNFLTINATKSINFLNNSTSQLFWRENEAMAFITNSEGQKVFGVMDVCNGLDLIFIYVSIIVLLPFSIKRKILFSIFGTVVLTFANIFRITCLFFISRYYHPAFDISHHYLFTALMYILIFYGWLLFIKTKPMQP